MSSRQPNTPESGFSATEQLSLDKCRGCGAVGLVERGAVPLCGRCLPNAYAIHLARETIQRAAGGNRE